jgi:predicted nucleotidyltransferase
MMQTRPSDPSLRADDVAWLAALKRDLTQALPGAVDAVILFGSRARGDAEPGSDYDVAVILRGHLADNYAIRRQVTDIAWDHQPDHGFIQVVPMNGALFTPPSTELAMRVAAEGIAVA